MLEPLRILHALHASNLEVELLAGEVTKRRIASDSMLIKNLGKYCQLVGSIEDTVLGYLLNFCMQRLGEQAGSFMMST